MKQLNQSFFLGAAAFLCSALCTSDITGQACVGDYIPDGDEMPCGEPGIPCCSEPFACNGPNSPCNNYDPDFQDTGGCDLSCTAGCMDEEAQNYDINADYDNGTCVFPVLDECDAIYNPDSNCDSLINYEDFLDFLGLFGENFIPPLPTNSSDSSETGASEFFCGQALEFAGNNYSTVRIGPSCWLAEDLKTTVLSNGTPLDYFTDSAEYINTYVAYNDDTTNSSTLSILYPEVVAANDSVCPTGWRVSSLSDWQEMLLDFNFSDEIDYFLKSTDWGGSNVLNFNATANGVRNVTGILPQGYFNLFENENAANHIGKYLEDFNDGAAQGWSYEGPVTTLTIDGEYELFYLWDCFWGGNNCTHTNSIYSPTFQMNASESALNVSFNIDVEWSSNCDYEYALYIQLNESGEWILLDSESCEFQGLRNYDLSAFSSSTLQFKWVVTYFEWSRITLDNFTLITSLYPGMDTPFVEDDYYGESYLGRWWSPGGESLNSVQMTSAGSGLEFLDATPQFFQSIRCVREE